jgi:hypothetical protein
MEEEKENMKPKAVPVVLRLALVSLLCVVTVTSVAAQDLPAKVEPYPIAVGVGKTVSLCATGTMMCPAYDPICDDTSVATMRRGADGLEIVGVMPGRTLCSASSANFVRVVYSVTVR